MARFIVKKHTNFRGLHDEAKYLLDLSQRIKNHQGKLAQEYKDVQVAIGNLSFVAKRFKQEKKIESLKDPYYALQAERGLRGNIAGSIYATIQFDPCIRDLVMLDCLNTIQAASLDLSNHCQRIFRNTGAESAKRFSSTFRALKQQVGRLNEILTYQTNLLISAGGLKQVQELTRRESLISTNEAVLQFWRKGAIENFKGTGDYGKNLWNKYERNWGGTNRFTEYARKISPKIQPDRTDFYMNRMKYRRFDFHDKWFGFFEATKAELLEFKGLQKIHPELRDYRKFKGVLEKEKSVGNILKKYKKEKK